MKSIEIASTKVSSIPVAANPGTEKKSVEGIIRRKTSAPTGEIKAKMIQEPKRRYIELAAGDIYGKFSPEYRVYTFWRLQRNALIDRIASRLKYDLKIEAYLIEGETYAILGKWFDDLCHDAIVELQEIAFPPSLKELSKEELLARLESRQSLAHDDEEINPDEIGADAILSIAQEMEALADRIRENLQSISIM